MAEGPDVFIAAEVPDSCEPPPIVAAGNQAWGPLQDQYEFITTKLSFSVPQGLSAPFIELGFHCVVLAGL